MSGARPTILAQRLVITGRLAEDACLRIATGRHPIGIVHLLIDQGSTLPQIQVEHVVGADATALQGARATCHQLMRRGAQVRVEALGIERRRVSEPLRLVGVLDVTAYIDPSRNTGRGAEPRANHTQESAAP